MSTSRTAQRPSSVAYLPRSHRSPLSARTRAEAILPALALTLTYFKKLTLCLGGLYPGLAKLW